MKIWLYYITDVDMAAVHSWEKKELMRIGTESPSVHRLLPNKRQNSNSSTVKGNSNFCELDYICCFNASHYTRVDSCPTPGQITDIDYLVNEVL